MSGRMQLATVAFPGTKHEDRQCAALRAFRGVFERVWSSGVRFHRRPLTEDDGPEGSLCVLCGRLDWSESSDPFALVACRVAVWVLGDSSPVDFAEDMDPVALGDPECSVEGVSPIESSAQLAPGCPP
jgi:hypothetical protein